MTKWQVAYVSQDSLHEIQLYCSDDRQFRDIIELAKSNTPFPIYADLIKAHDGKLCASIITSKANDLVPTVLMLRNYLSDNGWEPYDELTHWKRPVDS